MFRAIDPKVAFRNFSQGVGTFAKFANILNYPSQTLGLRFEPVS
jgi:hypothetical protein